MSVTDGDRGGAERRIRQDLAACYRLADRYRMTDGIGTHISARLPGAGHRLLLNPFGLLFEEVTASNLVEVTLDGTVMTPSGIINPAGFMIHAAVHEARPDVMCVMHTHTVAGVAVSIQQHGLLPISQQALMLARRVAYHNYEGIALSPAERATLQRDLADKDVLILRNHGLITAGQTIGEAFWLMLQMQRACEIQIAALAGGSALRQLDDDMCSLVHDQSYRYGGKPNGTRDWAAFRRQVERFAPDFAD